MNAYNTKQGLQAVVAKQLFWHSEECLAFKLNQERLFWHSEECLVFKLNQERLFWHSEECLAFKLNQERLFWHSEEADKLLGIKHRLNTQLL